MRVGLFIPCYVDAFHVEVGVATLELLERFGVDVEYPYDQTCCGQPVTKHRLPGGIRGDGGAVRQEFCAIRLYRLTVGKLHSSGSLQFGRHRADGGGKAGSRKDV